MLPANEAKLKEILDLGHRAYQRHHPSAFEHYSELMASEGLETAARWRCKTDLFFLALILGYRKIMERTHRRIAEFFVRKDPRKGMAQQDKVKRRMLLYPRGCYKSTFNMVDTVQWLLCFPEIVIFILSAGGELADGFVGEISDKFIKGKDAEPSLIQDLFPEYCILPKEKRVGSFTPGNRISYCKEHGIEIPKEPTVWGISIEQSLSGWHCIVMKPDDVVDNRNSKTINGLKTVKKNLHINRKMLRPWGYLEFSGTRYSPVDPYGEAIEKAKPGTLKVLLEPAYRVKPEAEGKVFEELAREDVELLFETNAEDEPELTWEFLQAEYDEDPESFASQYMNDPLGGHDEIFSKIALLQATVAKEQIPFSGDVFIAWRFSYSAKNAMKYTCGAAAVMHGGRLFVSDVIRGIFTPSTLANRIVQFAKKHSSHVVTIEETPGARYLEAAIKNYALVSGWPLSINWVPFEEDDAVRELRIQSAETHLSSTRLLISDGLSQAALKELYKQFTNFGMIEENEIPDVVSRLAGNLPRSIAAEEDKEQDEAWELMKRRELHDMVYAQGKYAEHEQEAPVVEHRPANPYGLDDILGGLNG
jgi:hypothetical protein